MADVTCIHCGQRIVRRDFLGREAWTHQPAGAAFMDHSHRPCHTTVATPPTHADDEQHDTKEDER